MSTTEQYIREEIAKDVATSITILEELKNDLLKVNSDLLPEDQLTIIAKGLKDLSNNLGRARLITIISAALSGGKDPE